jgi:histidinol-phosphate aminotransferase
LSRAFLAHNDVLLNAWPSFVVYRLSAAAMNRQEMTVPLTPDLHYDLEAMGRMAASPIGERVKLVFLGNPNNPTGHYLSKQALSRFFERLPAHVVVVIDEAYFEYVAREDYASCIDWVARRPRTVVLRTFSKIFGLAGMRIGFAVCDPEIAEILHRVRDPFNVSSVAQEAALSALSDVEHIKKGRDNNFSELPRVRAALQKDGHWVSDSVGNFVLLRLKDTQPGVEVVLEELLKRGIIVRPLLNYDLTRYLRVTIGLPEENDAFLRAYSDISNRA